MIFKTLKITISLSLLFLCFSIYAQIPTPTVSIHSPNAASLGLYGDVPVSYFTGVPNISIPLYTLKEKEITLPISLSYHASGVRPDVHPGWVGNGWSLSTPGVISRKVHGLPDDDNEIPPVTCQGGKSIFKAIGFYFTHNGLYPANWSTTDYLKNIDNNCSLYWAQDNEPDEFDFNFGNYSGKFYLDQNGHWKSTDRSLKITLVDSEPLRCPFKSRDSLLMGSGTWANGYPPSFKGFIITTPDGTQYVFGGSTSAVEYTINLFAQDTDFWIADSWHLSKIIGPDGSQVTFNYTRGPFIDQLSVSLYKNSTDVTQTNTGVLNFSTFLDVGCQIISGPIPPTGPYQGRLIAPVYLNEIDSEQGKIKFNISQTNELGLNNSYFFDQYVKNGNNGKQILYFIFNDPKDITTNLYPQKYSAYPDCLSRLQWQKLDSIQVFSNSNNQLLTQFNFGYTNDPNKRLTLLSVQQKGDANNVISPYRFYYDNSKTLPNYASLQIDHWGFFNGQTQNINTILNQDLSNYYSFRNTDTAYLKAGILNKIQYPTGGITNFQYEPNTYSSELNVPIWNPLVPEGIDQYCGGLRIRKIISQDPSFPNQTKTKEYFYIKNFKPANGFMGRSSGVLGMKAQYYWPDYTVSDVNVNLTKKVAIFSSQSVLPASENTAGTHIGYSEVVEKDQDGGVTQYRFSNFDNGHMDNPYVNNLQLPQSSYVPYNSKALERGKMIGKNIYNGAGYLIDSTTYTYAAFGDGADSIRAIKADIQYFCTNLGATIQEATAYYNYIYPYLLSSTTEIRYDTKGNKLVTTIENDNYENQYSSLNLKTFLNSKGQLLKTTYRYPFDVLPASPVVTVTTSTPITYMVNNHIIDQPLEVVSSKAINGVDQVISSTLTTFKGINITKPTGVTGITVKPAMQYKFEAAKPLPRSAYHNYIVVNKNGIEQDAVDTSLKKRLEFTNYDARGNIVTYNTLPSATGNPHYSSYLWGYNQIYPVAKITNAPANDAFYENFETGNGNSTLNDAKTGHYSFNGSYSNTLKGLDNNTYTLTYWQKSGTTWAFQVNNNISITGGTYTISLTGQIDDVCFYPTSAMMSTYVYDPLVGMTGSTDEKGEVTKYDYDVLQRLMNVRDKDENLTKSINYHYAIPNYPNDPLTGNYTTACSTGYTASVIPYTVPAGKYISHISPEDANQLAQKEMDANGPNNANTLGSCTLNAYVTLKNSTNSGYQVNFSNASFNITYNFPNNGSLLNLVVPTGTYTVSIYPTGAYTPHTIECGSQTQTNTPRFNFTGVNVSGSSLVLLVY